MSDLTTIDRAMRLRLRTMVRKIVRTADPDSVYLFGSQARGEATAGSDIDLLVIMPLHESRRDAYVRIGSALYGEPVPADVFVATPEELAHYGNTPGSLVYPAVHEGLLLYERPRSATPYREPVDREG